MYFLRVNAIKSAVHQAMEISRRMSDNPVTAAQCSVVVGWCCGGVVVVGCHAWYK